MKFIQLVIPFLILIIICPTVKVVSENKSLAFEIIGIKKYLKVRKNEFGSSFIITTKIQIINPSNENISFDHPDSCGFKTNITYFEHDNWDSIYHHGCFQAIKTEIFPPGTSNRTADGWINFPDETSAILPNGRYRISLNFAAWQDVEYKEDIGFIAEDGVISINPNFSKWDNNNSKLRLYFFPIQLILAALLILTCRKNSHSKIL